MHTKTLIARRDSVPLCDDALRFRPGRCMMGRGPATTGTDV